MASTSDFALADDKEYHVMFSFQSEDRAWVRKTLETLEAEPYGLKCCFADRDFHPGQDVLHNIETCMQKSMNIIIVISPEHMDSVYCDYEIGMAIDIRHQHKGRVIPVLRKGDHIPPSVRIINYIDARDGVDESEVIHKLVKAITQGLDTMATTYTLVESSESKAKNGEEVLQTSVRNKQKHCRSILSTLPPLAEDQLRECRSLGIQLTDAENFSLNKLLNDCQFIHDNWILFTHAGRLALLGFICAVCGNGFTLWLLLTYAGMNKETFIILAGMYYGLGVLLGAPIVFGLMTRALRGWALSQKDKLSGLISQSTYNRNLLVCIGNERNESVVRFVAYDVTECQIRVKEKLLGLASQTQTVDDTQVAEITETIIKRAIPSYIKVLIYSSHIAPRRRHMNKGDLVCLCQYIEQEQIHLKVFMEFIQHISSWYDLTRLCLDMCCRRRMRSREQLHLNDRSPNDDTEV